MKQSHCLRIKCPHFIPPSRAGLGGGPMAKLGRCGIAKRMVHRMAYCPLPSPIEKGENQ